MTQPFLPFALPDLGDREIAAVVEALQSGWITSGPRAKLFEEAFSRNLGDGIDCIAVNSATAGLHLALEAIGIGPGDEVIAPSLTFTATVEVVRYLGADPVVVDIDPLTLNIDPAAIRAHITPQTKAIVPVHYAGLACDMDAIFELADEFGLKVIEDAAHALPTTYGASNIGTLRSDATVFSFYANKTMTTGEGGMVATRSVELSKRMRVMRLHGIDRDAFDRYRSEKPSWYYEVVAPGFKYNMTDIAAAMGIVQLDRLPDFQVKRQFLADQYYEQLSALPLLLPPRPRQEDTHAWHLYVIRLNDEAVARGVDRDQLIAKLAHSGIGTSVHYVPLHRQPYWRDKYNLKTEMFPHTDKAYRTMVSIPLFTKMTAADQDRVISALNDAFA
jgi:dTDP-4-amino-4,6-dideoxygalactose transaminase